MGFWPSTKTTARLRSGSTGLRARPGAKNNPARASRHVGRGGSAFQSTGRDWPVKVRSVGASRRQARRPAFARQCVESWTHACCRTTRKPAFCRARTASRWLTPGMRGTFYEAISISRTTAPSSSTSRAARYPRIASWMFSRASGSVASCDQQPGSHPWRRASVESSRPSRGA